MGGFTIYHELETMDPLHKDVESFGIFEEADWTSYFERLIRFDVKVALQFAQNLMEDYLEVWGMRIEVFEQIILEITSLPREHERDGLVENSLCQVQKKISYQ